MSASALLELHLLLSVGAALLLAGIAAWLWRACPQQAARWLAVFLVARGAAGVVSTLRASSDVFLAANAWHFIVAATAPLPIIAIGFASLHPRPRGPLRHGWLIATAALLAASLSLAIDTLQPTATLQVQAGRIVPVEVGPLYLVDATFPLALASICLVFTRDALRTSGRERNILLLMGLGFGLDVSVQSFSGIASLLLGVAQVAPGPWGLANTILVVAALGPLLAAVALLAAHGFRNGDAELFRKQRQWLAFLSLAAASGIAMVFLAERSFGVSFFVLRALWRLPLAIVVAYALLKHHLFDVDVRLKLTIRKGTIAAAFLLIFFLVANVAQNYFTDSFGILLGGVSAGLMLFALHPLQRFAERVAEVALPGVHEPVPRGDERDAEAYRAAVEMALSDGLVTREEERALAKLAARLHIDAERALAIREQVEATVAGPA